jgi:Domain of unknown function (DUF4350)
MSAATPLRDNQHEQVRVSPLPAGARPARRGRRTTAGPRRRLPRWASALLWALLVLVVGTVLAVVSGGQPNNRALDPDNPQPDGARAVARVLDQHGVRVVVARSQADLLQQDLDGATLVVPDSQQLSGRNGRSALRAAARATDVVLLSPAPDLLADLALPVQIRPGGADVVEADCTGEGGAALDDRLTLTDVNRVVTATPAARGATACFRDATGSHWVHLPRAGDRPPVTVVGAQRFLTNDVVASVDNAAVALRLLGQSDRLVWYVPTVRDVAADDSSLPASLAPAWVLPSLWLVGSAVLALCLWRGRRLGRLVLEPLPVVVRAVETTESRGRLYRRARDRSRAVAVLQQATTRRLASYLGLATGTDASVVAAAAASVSGRRYDDVLRLLGPATVPDDASMLELATALTALEKEVRRR